MQDVFDTSGSPPEGWVNAVFDGGPYSDDVGRCVPTPPADRIEVGAVTYELVSLQAWPHSDYAVALYRVSG